MKVKREGQAQLATWISNESMARLKAWVVSEGTTITRILERALDQYAGNATPATPALPADDRLAELAAMLEDHERRLAALESNQQLDNGLDSIINELARQGLKQSAIAEALNQRGYQTTTGQPFHRGNSRIAKAVKLASSHQLDNELDNGSDE
jgi:hypothetical protein